MTTSSDGTFAALRDDGVLEHIRLPRLGSSVVVVLTLVGIVPLLVVEGLASSGHWETGIGVALACYLVLAAVGCSTPLVGPFDWLVPPLLRIAEYVTIVRLAALVGGHALPAAFAVVAALAYHHYDIVYRLRQQQRPPSAWIGLVGGGWAVRLAAAYACAVGGVLAPALVAAAILLGGAFAAESIVSWYRFSERSSAPTFQPDEDEPE